MTAVSAVTGGLKAAIYTEVLQAVTSMIGTGAIFILGKTIRIISVSLSLLARTALLDL